MLLELKVKNLAIIDELSLATGPGLNVLTGESGAGKSILIDAITLILGDRAGAEIIRDGTEEATVEALFDMPDDAELSAKLEEAGIETSENLIIKRVRHISGRNKAYINGSLTTLMVLSEIGRYLVDIYGQSEHQSLTRPESHVELLDSFGGHGKLRQEMASAYWKWASIKKELDGLRIRIKSGSEDRELLQFQSEEIGQAALKPGEEEELKKAHKRLKNAEKIKGLANGAERAIYSDSSSIVERIGIISNALKEAASVDGELGKTGERLASIVFELEDSAEVLRNLGNRDGTDPARLEELEARLDMIIKLKRKYGATIEEILRKKKDIDTTLGSIEDFKGMTKALEERLVVASDEISIAALTLSGARNEKASSLKEGMEAELTELGMSGAIFEVLIESEASPDGTARYTERGSDRVSFLISTNPGEKVKPLAKIASGGELSRIMLAMKSLSTKGRVETLVFDEVDTGVGGAMSDVVAKKLLKVSMLHQVFCITHLPQIAAYADRHYRVIKGQNAEGRTVTMVKYLSSKEREDDISRMLGGPSITETTRLHAKELLKLAGK